MDYDFGSANGFNDVSGRVESVIVTAPGGSAVPVASYEYLGSGRLVNQKLEATGGLLSNSVHVAGNFDTLLDRFNRVIDNNWTGAGTIAQQFKVSYDNASNITVVEDPLLVDLDANAGPAWVNSFSTKFTWMEGIGRHGRIVEC